MNKFFQILFLLITTIVQSQITGIVKDTSGQPLPYVNIFIENTYKGTTSNEDGYFELNISKTGNHTVVFQFLGYKTLQKKLLQDSVNKEKVKYNLSINEESILYDLLSDNTKYIEYDRNKQYIIGFYNLIYRFENKNNIYLINDIKIKKKKYLYVF